jgi:hypothetical protein
MLVWCQSLWVDAMLSLDSLRVLSPEQLGARLRVPSLGEVRSTREADSDTWHQVDLQKADMSTDSGVLSLTLARPVKLVRQLRTNASDHTAAGGLEMFGDGVERVELGIGRKGVAMWAMHDEIAWADCQPDDALVPPFDVLCLSATGNTWFGTREEAPASGQEPHGGDVAYILAAVEMALLRSRLGTGEARAPSPFLYRTWQAHGELSATWLQTWIATLPHTAKVPWRLAGGAARRQPAAGARRVDEGSAEARGKSMGRDVEAARFYAGSLQRIVPAASAGRPFSKLRQEAIDASSLAALKTIWRCQGGVHKRFPGRELWWRPPIVMPALGSDSPTYGECQWAISAGTQVLEEAGQALEKPAVGLRLRLLYLLFLRTHSEEGRSTAEMQNVCSSAAAARAHNAGVFQQYSTDFAGYMTEDISLTRILSAYRRARQEASGGYSPREGLDQDQAAAGADVLSRQYAIDVGANGCELSVEIGKVLGRNIFIAALEPLPALGRCQGPASLPLAPLAPRYMDTEQDSLLSKQVATDSDRVRG